MIPVGSITEVIVVGLKDHLALAHVVEMDQDAPKPPYPFVGFKWTTITPELGSNRRTMQAVPSPDPRWEKDVEYRYVRNPVATLSVTVFDRPDSERIHELTYAAHMWFSIPELAGDALAELEATIVEVTEITDRDTVLDREIERRQGFDVRMRVVDVVEVRVPTIETVQVSGLGGEVEEEIDL